MANNYTQFSICVEMTAEHAQRVVDVFSDIEDLNTINTATGGDFDDDSVSDMFSGLEYEIDRDGNLYIYSEEAANPDGAAFIIQWAMRQWPDDVQKRLVFSYAYTCSKPRPDEFGGCALYVDKDEIDYCSPVGVLMERHEVEA